MTNELITKSFNFNGSNLTTIIDGNGNPWWVAKEVCEVLGYAAPRNAVNMHCKHAKLLRGTESVRLGFNPRGINIIPESDLYRLTIKSNLPTAGEFERMVMEEILPAIRKTGSYSSQLEIPKTYPAALRALATEFEKRIDAEKIVADQKPKIEEYNTFLNTEGLYSLTEAGKLVTGKPNKFTALLRDKKVLYLRNGVNLPRQRYLNAGYFEVRAMRPNASSFTQTFVTPRGLPALLRICNPGTQVALF